MSAKENAQVREASIGADVLLEMEARPILMHWDIKAHAHPTVYVDVPMIAIGSFPLMCYLYGAFFHQNENTKHLFTDTALFGMALVFFLWVTIARQKTFYSYRISEKGGEVDYWLYFPKCAGWIFKGIAIFALVTVLAIVSIMPMMIFALVGVGAITIPAALKLLAWENEIDSGSFEWGRVQLIVADRKRSLVVLQRRYHPDIPFEQNYMYFKVFLPKQRFDEFIEACKQYAPSTVDFEEGNAGY